MMSFRIVSVVNSSEPKGEYVRLKTDEAINARGYAVVDRTFDENEKVSNEFRHIYVFGDLELEAGDWVRLHTGTGRYKKSENEGDTYTHHVYWGSEECVWNDNGGDKASLIKYTVVNTVKVPAVE